MSWSRLTLGGRESPPETSQIAAFLRRLPVPRRESRAAPQPRFGGCTPPRTWAAQETGVGISTAAYHEATDAEATAGGARGEVGSLETRSWCREGKSRLVSRRNRSAHVAPHASLGLCGDSPVASGRARAGLRVLRAEVQAVGDDARSCRAAARPVGVRPS